MITGRNDRFRPIAVITMTRQHADMRLVVVLSLVALAGCARPMEAAPVGARASEGVFVYRNGLNEQISIDLRAMTANVEGKVVRLKSCSREGVQCVSSDLLKIVAPDKCQVGQFSHLETLQRLGVRHFSMDGTHGAAFYAANQGSGYSYDPYDGVVRLFLMTPKDVLDGTYDPTDRPREVFDLQTKVGPFGCMSR